MSITTENSRNAYVGDGTTDTFTYTFRIFSANDLVVAIEDDDGDVTLLAYPTDYTVTGVGQNGGGTIALDNNLAVDHKLVIKRLRPITQTTSIKNESQYFAATHENTFDKLVMIDQQQQEQIGRSIKLAPTTEGFNPTLPTVLEANRTIVVGPGGASLALGPTPDELTQATADVAAAAAAAEAAQEAADLALQTLKPGGLTGQILTKVSDDDYDTAWEDAEEFDDTGYAYSGYSSRFASNFSSTDLGDTLSKILLITYAGPLVSLTASGSGTVREKGSTVTAVSLSANVTKRSNNIDEVRFYKDAGLINTIASPSASGGTESYNWSGSFADNASFSVQVDDVSGGGGPTTATDTRSFTFVYPYYVGAGAAAAGESQLEAMTKLVIVSTATLNRTITATNGQYMYVAYPASYGALTSILDVNGFEVIGSWTGSILNITGLDGNAVSYRKYESNNPVVAGDYYFSFRR